MVMTSFMSEGVESNIRHRELRSGDVLSMDGAGWWLGAPRALALERLPLMIVAAFHNQIKGSTVSS